jgi:hypothetical protein
MIARLDDYLVAVMAIIGICFLAMKRVVAAMIMITRIGL